MAKIMEEENENCEVKAIHKDIVEKVILKSKYQKLKMWKN